MLSEGNGGKTLGAPGVWKQYNRLEVLRLRTGRVPFNGAVWGDRVCPIENPAATWVDRMAGRWYDLLYKSYHGRRSA